MDSDLQAVAKGTKLWDELFTKEDECALHAYCTTGEGAAISAAVMAQKHEKLRTLRWADEDAPSVEIITPAVVLAAQPLALDDGFQMVMPKAMPKAMPKIAPQMPQVPNPNQIKTLVVRNLPRDIVELELQNYFGKYGNIHDVYIPKNTDRNSPYFGTIKGFALIKFKHYRESACAAAEKGLCIRGKNIFLELANQDR
jgi:hypothetical protein